MELKSIKSLWIITLLLLIAGGCAWFLFRGTEEQAYLEDVAEYELEALSSAAGIENGYGYVDLGLSVKWATYNVGANSPEEYGNYYAWGETTTKTSYTEENCSTYGKSIGSIAGNSTYDVARALWGGGWRLPTKEEFEELRDRCTWNWTTYKGVNGYKVTGPNGNSIFLPAAGWFGASLSGRGTLGYYWSATPYEESNPYVSNSGNAYYLDFGSGRYHMYWLVRYNGRSVRPVSD